MPTLEEAKAAYGREKAKFTGALSTLAGSRWLTAIAATFALSFGSTWAYAPTRLPHLSGFGLPALGLPDTLDFGAAGAKIEEAVGSATGHGAGEAAGNFLGQHPDWIPWLNAAGFGIALAALLGNLWVMTARRRTTRG
jgi:hypothetical protein